MVIPTADGAIKASGLSKAFEGQPTVDYEASCDCMTEFGDRRWSTPRTRHAGSFVSHDRRGAGAGLAGRTSASTTSRGRSPIRPSPARSLGITGWNFGFAIITVLITFAAGLLVAVTLNSPRLRGLRFYRVLIVLPYAMPSFAMLLVWRDMFNADFGLINSITGLNINWYGDVWTARFAILLIQFWLGYPYMFLVCLGALQSIPQDMTEAAAVDGARPYQAFRAVVFPLLLIAVAPLLIASFAFNFNNFNVIQLTTGGAPFPPDNPKAGGTDILVSYVYRLAFAEGGAQYGFAAAVSVLIFVIVARRLDHRLPADRRPRGDQPMTGQSWFAAVGWRHIVAIVAVIFALIPILFTASAAFNPLGTLSSTSLIPKDFGLENFQNLFSKTDFAHWFFNSILIAGSATVISLAMATFAAYAFSRFRFSGRRPGLLFLLIVQMFPAFLAIVVLYLMFTRISDLYPIIGFNTPWSLVLIYLGGALGVNTWLIKGFFDTVPKELDESAKVDGASHLHDIPDRSSCRS